MERARPDIAKAQELDPAHEWVQEMAKRLAREGNS